MNNAIRKLLILKAMTKTGLLILVITMFGLSGCGDSKRAEADKAVQVMQQSFDTAPDVLKANYQAVKTALASNDFVKAKASLDQLQAAELSPEQQQAVAEQRQALMLKASAAAQQGDMNAAKVIQEVRLRSRPR